MGVVASSRKTNTEMFVVCRLRTQCQMSKEGTREVSASMRQLPLDSEEGKTCNCQPAMPSAKRQLARETRGRKQAPEYEPVSVLGLKARQGKSKCRIAPDLRRQDPCVSAEMAASYSTLATFHASKAQSHSKEGWEYVYSHTHVVQSKPNENRSQEYQC